MSADFIKMISEIHSERFLVQVQNLIRNKIPCGFFTGFTFYRSVLDIANNLRNNGLNLTCICCLDANQMGGGRGKFKFAVSQTRRFCKF